MADIHQAGLLHCVRQCATVITMRTQHCHCFHKKVRRLLTLVMWWRLGFSKLPCTPYISCNQGMWAVLELQYELPLIWFGCSFLLDARLGFKLKFKYIRCVFLFLEWAVSSWVWFERGAILKAGACSGFERGSEECKVAPLHSAHMLWPHHLNNKCFLVVLQWRAFILKH